MTPRRTRAILVDALGTLVQLEPPAPRLRAELSTRFGVALGEAEGERAIGAEIDYYRAHLDEGRDDPSLTSLRLRCAEVLRDALPVAVGARLGDLDAVVDALLASLRFRPFADAPPALMEWRSRGLRLVVVSNWDVSLRGVLDTAGLTPLLDGVLTSAEAGARKPAAAIFEQALRLAGVGAEEAIHVGDSVEEDVEGARDAGIQPVLLSRGQADHGAAGVRTISSLAELSC